MTYKKMIVISSFATYLLGFSQETFSAEKTEWENLLTSPVVSLANRQIGNKDLEHISEALKVNTTCTSLDLSNNKIFQIKGAQYIADALKINTTLTSLDLSHNKISAGGFSALSSSLCINTTLTFLNLSNNEVYDNGFQSIIGSLNYYKSLTSLVLSKIGGINAHSLYNKLKENTTLTSLDLSSSQIVEGTEKYIYWALKQNSTLISINLENTHLRGDTNINELLDSLKVNKKITYLNLERNEISLVHIDSINVFLESNKVS